MTSRSSSRRRKCHSFASRAALAAHMQADKDLDPLRQRADFKKLVEELKGQK